MSRLAGLCVALVVSACGFDQSQVDNGSGRYRPLNLFEEKAGERVFRDEVLDTMWTYGIGDTVLASASTVATFSGTDDVAILDVTGQRVHRIGPSGLVWSWGKRGQGPGELWNVRAMTVDVHGNVVLVDSGNRRVIWVSAAGEWLREIEIAGGVGSWGGGIVNGIVAFDDQGYVLAGDGVEPWIFLSSEGEWERAVVPHWTGFDEMHYLQTYGMMSGGQNGLWVFGFSMGNGFFVFSGGEHRGSYPYIEHVDFPALVMSSMGSDRVRVSYTEPPIRAADDLVVEDNQVIVLVRNWMLDRYDLMSGEYLETTVLPGPAKSVAFSDTALIIIEAGGLFPTVTALSPVAQGS